MVVPRFDPSLSDETGLYQGTSSDVPQRVKHDLGFSPWMGLFMMWPVTPTVADH